LPTLGSPTIPSRSMIVRSQESGVGSRERVDSAQLAMKQYWPSSMNN